MGVFQSDENVVSFSYWRLHGYAFFKMINFIVCKSSVKKENTLCFGVVTGIIRDHSPSPFFILFGSSLSSAASMSLL